MTTRAAETRRTRAVPVIVLSKLSEPTTNLLHYETKRVISTTRLLGGAYETWEIFWGECPDNPDSEPIVFGAAEINGVVRSRALWRDAIWEIADDQKVTLLRRLITMLRKSH